MRRAIPVLFILAMLAGCGGPAPTPTNTAFARWRTADVQRAFQAAGLAAGNWRDHPASEMGDAPRVWLEDKAFIATSGYEGYVQTFGSEERWGQVLNWHGARAVAGTNPLPNLYTRDNIILVIDGRMLKAEADKYKAALDAMK